MEGTHVIGGETKAQRGDQTGPRPHSKSILRGWVEAAEARRTDTLCLEKCSSFGALAHKGVGP